jgi:hypothetical protein
VHGRCQIEVCSNLSLLSFSGIEDH